MAIDVAREPAEPPTPPTPPAPPTPSTRSPRSTRSLRSTQPSPAEHPPARDAISTRARALGLTTVQALKLEVLRQRPVWWQGRAFHCPLCDLDFTEAPIAAEHVVHHQHPVLRMDVEDAGATLTHLHLARWPGQSPST